MIDLYHFPSLPAWSLPDGSTEEDLASVQLDVTIRVDPALAAETPEACDCGSPFCREQRSPLHCRRGF